MPPAARVTDLQVSPGGSGPLAAGSANVFIGGQPAARAGDATGTGGVIASGSPTVFIGGKPAARVGDRTSGSGLLLTGTGNVLIGDRAGVGRLEAIGGGPNAGTPPRPGDEKKLKELEKKEKKEQEKQEKAAKEQAKKDAEAAGAVDDGEGLSLLGSPASAELIGAFLKMAEGLFGQLAGVMPPAMRELVASSLASAQKALGGMQIGPLNQSVAQLQAAMQQVQGQVPPEAMAAAAAQAGGAAPGGAPGAAPAGGPPGLGVGTVEAVTGGSGPRLDVGEGSVLDSVPIQPKKG